MPIKICAKLVKETDCWKIGYKFAFVLRMRYFLDISYRGTDYHGWQYQKNAITVQETIEKALHKIFQADTPITGSGRTDTGVHATQQVAHFDQAVQFDPEELVYKLNSILPKSIAVNSCKRVKEDAHARFDALTRRYHYHIHQHKNPFSVGVSYYFKPELDTDGINRACELLKTWTEFESFSKVKTDVKTFDCNINDARWLETSTGYLFDISANRFLRGMVRALVGTLIDLGLGKLSLQEFALIKEQKHRSAAGTSVPAEGLFLQEVKYPESIYQ